MPRPTGFVGPVVVTSKIVDYLSSGLYESPAACLKELVNNAYDADAKTVQVFVRPDADRIIVADDGHGMSADEFKRHFSRVSESYKRVEDDETVSGRPKIGKIGIGFIAANEICDELEIFSTKRGSEELLHVVVDFAGMRSDAESRRLADGTIQKADYHGEVLKAGRSEHYTQLYLNGVRGEARTILANAAARGKGAKHRTLYGCDPEAFVEALRDPSVVSWQDFDEYSETLLEVALNVPVRYAPGWLPPRLRKKVGALEKEVDDLGFRVLYDAVELFKPVVLPLAPDALVLPFSFDGENVAAKGYFYVHYGALKPRELNGLLIRIRHAAVGDYDGTFLGYETSKYTIFQRWVSCEIWADDRLEDAMNIDRRTLRVAHPAYTELKKAIHDRLDEVLALARRDLHQAGSRERNASRAGRQVQAIAEILERAGEKALPAKARRVVLRRWETVAGGAEGAKAASKRYTVAEFYKIALEVATEVLSPRDREEFIAELTTRLAGLEDA